MKNNIILCQTLTQQGQLKLIPSRGHLVIQEQRSLTRLRQQPAIFLNAYDRLFRHLSLHLLAHGYAITATKPHQTLQQFMQQLMPSQDVQHMILLRHTLKHGEQCRPSVIAQRTLYGLLLCFDGDDAQAYNHQLNIPTCVMAGHITLINREENV
jgi:hypothetical protein